MKTAFLRSWRLANAPPIAVPPQAYQNLHYQWTDLRERLQEAMVFISKCMGLQSLFPPIESVEK
jgi:hypothetical protein